MNKLKKLTALSMGLLLAANFNLTGIVSAEGAVADGIQQAGNLENIVNIGDKISEALNEVSNIELGKSASEIKTQIKDTYTAARQRRADLNGISYASASFNGRCGAYVSLQLDVLGISKNTELYGDGNAWWSRMSKMNETCKGYKMTKFPGENCINDIVSAYNGKNVYNIVVAFNKGIGDAGIKYGHVMFIHAIIDGKVYYSESYAYGSIPEGGVHEKSISDYYKMYKGYTFDGAVVFGGSTPAPVEGMKVSGETKPTGQLKEGHYFELKGIITSGKPITKVWGGVYVRGGLATGEYCEAKPNTTSYDLHGKFNDEIIFDNLKVGYYTYKIEASDSDGKTYTLINSDFQIGSPSYTSKSVKVTFYRNLDADDQHSVNEIFTNGVANQRFGYTPDGKGRYRTMNDPDKGFGEWVKDGYTLLGWSEDRNSSEGNYKVYSGVKDSWIESKSPEISLYAIWAPVSSPDDVPETVTGDIDENDIVDMTDLSDLSLYLLGDFELKTENQIKAADINHDGSINLADLSRLKQFISKMIDKM